MHINLKLISTKKSNRSHRISLYTGNHDQLREIEMEMSQEMEELEREFKSIRGRIYKINQFGLMVV